jgi:hypothetical protein
MIHLLPEYINAGKGDLHVRNNGMGGFYMRFEE